MLQWPNELSQLRIGTSETRKGNKVRIKSVSFALLSDTCGEIS